MSQPVSPSGTSWTIRSGTCSATVVSVGGGLREFLCDGVAALLGYGEAEMCHGGIGQLLIPWPNRIADGRYTFEGGERQLPLSEPARHNASHGLVRWVEWQRVDGGPDHVVVAHRLHGQPGYPHQLDLTARYTVSAEGLAVEVTAVNVGASPAPYGFGAHPYLTVGRRLDECELSFTAGHRLDVDPDRLLPRDLLDVAGSPYDFSTPRLLGDLTIDYAFTGLAPAADAAGADRTWTVRLTDPESGRTTALSSDTPWVQLFTADPLDRSALAVEPMTCPPNAFATGTDLITLKPGETHTNHFTVTADS
jgi:aldose 1-epimerase